MDQVYLAQIGLQAAKDRAWGPGITDRMQRWQVILKSVESEWGKHEWLTWEYLEMEFGELSQKRLI